jgi:hypothetical protein
MKMDLDEAKLQLASVWRSRAARHMINAFAAEDEDRLSEAKRYHAMADHAIDMAQKYQPL